MRLASYRLYITPYGARRESIVAEEKAILCATVGRLGVTEPPNVHRRRRKGPFVRDSGQIRATELGGKVQRGGSVGGVGGRRRREASEGKFRGTDRWEASEGKRDGAFHMVPLYRVPRFPLRVLGRQGAASPISPHPAVPNRAFPLGLHLDPHTQTLHYDLGLTKQMKIASSILAAMMAFVLTNVS